MINLLNNSTKFEKYDTINSVKRLVLFGKYELPIKLESLKKEEYFLDEVSYTKDQAEIIAKTTALKNVKNKIPLEAQIISSEYNVFEDDNEIIVRVTVECIEAVGQKEEIK